GGVRVRLGRGRILQPVGDQVGGNVPLLPGRVDAPEVPDPLEVLRVLAGADENLLLVNDPRADEGAPRTLAAGLILRVLRVGVELPDLLARLRLEAVDPPVAAREDHLRLPLDYAVCRVGPLAVHDVPAGQVALPDDLATLPAQAQEARGLREWDVD